MFQEDKSDPKSNIMLQDKGIREDFYSHWKSLKDKLSDNLFHKFVRRYQLIYDLKTSNRTIWSPSLLCGISLIYNHDLQFRQVIGLLDP